MVVVVDEVVDCTGVRVGFTPVDVVEGFSEVDSLIVVFDFSTGIDVVVVNEAVKFIVCGFVGVGSASVNVVKGNDVVVIDSLIVVSDFSVDISLSFDEELSLEVLFSGVESTSTGVDVVVVNGVVEVVDCEVVGVGSASVDVVEG